MMEMVGYVHGDGDVIFILNTSPNRYNIFLIDVILAIAEYMLWRRQCRLKTAVSKQLQLYAADI